MRTIKTHLAFRQEAAVATTPVEVQGTLTADGALVLDQKPNLPPGRVHVSLRPVEGEADVIEVLRRIHAEQAASGYVPRSREEIDADFAAMRQEDEECMPAIERLHEECQRGRQQAPPAEDSFPAKELTLDDLVSRITPENVHGETDWGPPAGREAW
jgi:hypothetical protein